MNNRKFIVLSFLMTPLVFGSFFAGFWARGHQEHVSKTQIGKVREIASYIEGRYVTPVDEEKLFQGAFNGMMSKLDPYSEYFSKQEWADFDAMNLKGQFGGVGILVEPDKDTGYVNVRTPLEDSPAFREDILPGDKIVKVDGKDIKGQTLQETVRQIKGEPGTRVTVTFVRKSRPDPFEITLTRAIVEVKVVKEKMLDDGIGYIRIVEFSRMMKAFDEAADRLIKQGARALIVDLRYNGGGLLDECVKLADRFLPKGAVVVTTKGRTSGDNRELKAAGEDHHLPELPLVVLVNEGTASASEIFSGAMKDHKRGVLVGTRTYGKGSVQSPFLLGDESAIKITTAKYYTPNGTSVHREEGKKDYGLEPDYRVEMTSEEIAKLFKQWDDERIQKGEKPKPDGKFVDLQLEAAKEAAKAKLENREPKVAERILDKDKPKDK